MWHITTDEIKIPNTLVDVLTKLVSGIINIRHQCLLQTGQQLVMATIAPIP